MGECPLLKHGGHVDAAACSRDLARRFPESAVAWVWLMATSDSLAEHLRFLRTTAEDVPAHRFAPDARTFAHG